MIRRKFLGLMTLAGASGVAALSVAKAAGQKETVTYKIQGFTCITCATGLETLLGREKGVLAVKAIYSDGSATVAYDAHAISETEIREAIESLGFKAETVHATAAATATPNPSAA